MADPDVFISYARDDAATARKFADGLEAAGLTVWWDDALRSGQVFDEAIEQALRAAKAVVVLWSPASVQSRWVRAEATLADRKGTLVPVTIAPCERPIIFEMIQTADFSRWDGRPTDPAWREFASHVREILSNEGSEIPRSAAREPLPRLDQLSVVVLPFSNLGRDEEQEYFADGITEDVITDLGKVSALSVIARNTAFTFKDQLVDVQKLASQLNVTHVLEGSVRRAGNRVRVNAQLVDGSTGAQVWAERWDRDLDDIFELQDELSQEIVKALKVRLLPGEKKAIEDRGTDNVQAYDLYMRARAAASSANSVEQCRAAYDLYKQVLAVDPQFTPAQAGFAVQAQQLANITDQYRDLVITDLKSYHSAALRYAPDGWATHLLFALRMTAEGNPIAGFDSMEIAATKAPAFDADVSATFGWSYGHVGRVSDAIAVLERARRVDPLSANLSIYFQIVALCAGRIEESRLEYERFRQSGGAREEMEHNSLFRVWLTGDIDAIRVQYRRFLDTRAVPIPELDTCYDLIDRHDAALEVLAKGLEAPENQHGIRQFLLAIHAGLHGGTDLALKGLRRAVLDYRSVAGNMMWYPAFRETRQLPGFKQIIRDLGISDYWRESGQWGDFARPVGDDEFEIIA